MTCDRCDDPTAKRHICGEWWCDICIMALLVVMAEDVREERAFKRLSDDIKCQTVEN